jgi:hypothetical protein
MSQIERVIYLMPQGVPVNWTATLFVRGVPPGVGQRVQSLATRLEPQVTVTERPLVDYVRDSLGRAALASRVAWAIGALGLALAFGVFAQVVEERRREIGIRMALGARPRQIAGVVCRTASQALQAHRSIDLVVGPNQLVHLRPVGLHVGPGVCEILGAKGGVVLEQRGLAHPEPAVLFEHAHGNARADDAGLPAADPGCALDTRTSRWPSYGNCGVWAIAV